jgi:hypothetical protein
MGYKSQLNSSGYLPDDTSINIEAYKLSIIDNNITSES